MKQAQKDAPVRTCCSPGFSNFTAPCVPPTPGLRFCLVLTRNPIPTLRGRPAGALGQQLPADHPGCPAGDRASTPGARTPGSGPHSPPRQPEPGSTPLAAGRLPRWDGRSAPPPPPVLPTAWPSTKSLRTGTLDGGYHWAHLCTSLVLPPGGTPHPTRGRPLPSLVHLLAAA